MPAGATFGVHYRMCLKRTCEVCLYKAERNSALNARPAFPLCLGQFFFCLPSAIMYEKLISNILTYERQTKMNKKKKKKGDE